MSTMEKGEVNIRRMARSDIDRKISGGRGLRIAGYQLHTFGAYCYNHSWWKLKD